MADKIPTRDGFGKALVEIGKENKKIVMVSADLEDATRAEYFRDAYPDRFFTVGIAEQDMVGMAAGLAKTGFTAFVNSFAVFLTNRAYDMLRMDVCYNNTNVKVVCTHAGITVGEDGASAQSLEDIALMRVLPNMTVIIPVDAIEAAKATKAIAEKDGPMYLRTSRSPFPILTDESTPFEIGKANVLRVGKDVTLIGCGITVSESLNAAEKLSKEGIEAMVINLHTIKPIDVNMIVDAARKTGAIVTSEEHQIYAGVGSAVAEVVAQNCPVPMEFVAIKDCFGESGTPDELMAKYHLKDVDIYEAAKKVIARKNK